jgi:hypothetical protein
VGLLFLFSIATHAQTFSSGSTGADGALNLAMMNCPNNICAVQLPESGILNYTTVNVPAGKSLIFNRNSHNTPVIMLTQGNVTIGGIISVAPPVLYPRQSIEPGPGGFYGGDLGQPGLGPGGGQVPAGAGKWVGPLSLQPLVGGSGGAGGENGLHGGGGGGAILIASSTSITLSAGSAIIADGINSLVGVGTGSYGSGGAIRLVANVLNVSGSFSACGGNCGVIRLEAPSGALTFTGSATPAAVLSPINPTVVSTAPPSLTIVSIGGHAVPSYAGSRFDTVDLLLPNQLTDPITVVVRGNNIPLGTQVEIRAVNGSSQATYTPGTLAGTFENSTASPSISGLNRTSVTYLLASAMFDPPASAANFNPKGPDQVAKVRVETTLGARPKYLFLRSNGSVIETGKLSSSFLRLFAQ